VVTVDPPDDALGSTHGGDGYHADGNVLMKYHADVAGGALRIRSGAITLCIGGASVKPVLSCELKGVHHRNDPLAM
jgi:hypothetical protein